MLSDSGESVQ